MASVSYYKKCPRCNGIFEFEYFLHLDETYTLFSSCKCQKKTKHEDLLDLSPKEQEEMDNLKWKLLKERIRSDE